MKLFVICIGGKPLVGITFWVSVVKLDKGEQWVYLPPMAIIVTVVSDPVNLYLLC